MKKIIKFLLLVFPLLFSGCLRTYYPLHSGISSTPMIFETDLAPNETSKYIGAEVTAAQGFHKGETFAIARSIFSTAHTTKYTNTNFEAFTFVGNYNVNNLTPKYNGSKFAMGVGGSFKFALNLNVDNSKLGVGFNLGLQTEFGDYTNFRKSASSEGIINSSVETLSPNFSVFPFIVFPISESTILSVQINVGILEGITSSLVLSGEKISGWTSFIYLDENANYITRKFVFGMKYRL